MATNDKHQTIIKRIFGANNGKQLALLRQKLEVMEFLNECSLTGLVPNEAQQKHISEVILEYEKYNQEINNYLGVTTLKDMKDEVEE